MSSSDRASPSLKRGFLKHFILVTLAVWGIASAITYFVAKHELNELYDGELAQTARVLLSIYSDNISNNSDSVKVTSSPFEGGENYERKLVFQIWDHTDKLLIRSANAPLQALTDKLNQFETSVQFGNEIRTLAISSPESQMVVKVGQNMDFRREAIEETMNPLIIMLLIVFPLSFFLISRAIDRGVKPLLTLSRDIEERTPNNLTPIETFGTPIEMRGIVDALNGLMIQLRNTLTRERSFISNAAHELRTPLAGMKAQVQVALKYPAHIDKSLTNIVEGIDRTTRLANQLLTLSGVDSLIRLEKSENVNCKHLIVSVVRDLSGLLETKSQVIDIKLNSDIEVSGDDALLYTLFRNLIENALNYSPNHSKIRIAGFRNNAELAIFIIDQGPGIPIEKRARVFERFYRNTDTTQSGSGLGLTIVSIIAKLHNASVELTSNENAVGLCVVVSFRAIH
ncbi:MAG: two-component system sensor histidine kinase QseC [Gammaproteobacteria bacterium]|jgi:two-component system sensor histidine kinase QseC